MPISPDLLKDFIDGKLGQEEASAVAASIAGDPDLAAYVEDQKALKTALSSPAAVWLRGLNERVAVHGANWIPVFAMAAGIGLGVLLAGTFGMGSDLRSQDGTLIVQGALAQSLSTALTGEESAGAAAARITASFWSKNGSFCRSFVTRGTAESALAGVACRERGAWRIAAMATMAPITPLQAPAVTEALPPSVRGVMDNLIVGQPLDPDAERQIRNQGWRAR
jgi:anti-sigma factor RsiW